MSDADHQNISTLSFWQDDNTQLTAIYYNVEGCKTWWEITPTGRTGMHMAAAEALTAGHLVTGDVTDGSSGLPLTVCRYNESADKRSAEDVVSDLYEDIASRSDKQSIRLFTVEAPEKLRLHCEQTPKDMFIRESYFDHYFLCAPVMCFSATP